MLRIVNRVLLGLTGLVLLGFGLAALAAALDLPGRLGLDPPSFWTWREPHDVPLTEADRLRRREEGWWWPTVIGAVAVLVLLLLWWLLAQLRRARLEEVVVRSAEGGEGVAALLRGRALEDVLAAEAEALPGIDQARVTLTGRRTQPRARIGLLLAPQARPAEAVRRLREEALETARRSAGLSALPAEVRLRSAHHAAERVS